MFGSLPAAHHFGHRREGPDTHPISEGGVVSSRLPRDRRSGSLRTRGARSCAETGLLFHTGAARGVRGPVQGRIRGVERTVDGYASLRDYALIGHGRSRPPWPATARSTGFACRTSTRPRSSRGSSTPTAAARSTSSRQRPSSPAAAPSRLERARDHLQDGGRLRAPDGCHEPLARRPSLAVARAPAASLKASTAPCRRAPASSGASTTAGAARGSNAAVDTASPSTHRGGRPRRLGGRASRHRTGEHEALQAEFRLQRVPPRCSRSSRRTQPAARAPRAGTTPSSGSGTRP